MGRSRELVLVYKGMPKVSLKDKFNIVLTPQNYILKKENLPIKKEYQSKKIVSSIFDSFIDNKEDYLFFVYKDDEDWTFIAYKQQEIINLLKEVGIPLSNIDGIFFAQQMISSISNPISLGVDKAMVTIDKIVTVVPKNILPKDTIYTDLSTNILPKKSATLSTTHSYLDRKTSIILSVVFSIFAISFIMEGLRYTTSSHQQSVEVQEIIQHYPKLQSSYTRDSILAKYTRIDTEQRKKRELIKKLSKLINQKVKIENFQLNQNNYTATLSTPDKNIIDIIKQKIKSTKMQISNISSNQLTIKGHL